MKSQNNANLDPSLGTARAATSPIVKAAPASLDTGLDILEYLAQTRASATSSAIASALNISQREAERAVLFLEQRGFVVCAGEPASYRSACWPSHLPVAPFAQRRLLTLARPIMQALSDGISQSCNLAIPSVPDLQVIAQQESSGPFGINVPLGFRYDIPGSAAGIVFAAFAKNSDPAQWPNGGALNNDLPEWEALKKAVQRTSELGFAQIGNAYLTDAIDLSCPVFEQGHFVAALTVSFITTTGGANLTWSLAALQEAAEALSDLLQRDAFAA